jgi:hypothetical protein
MATFGELRKEIWKRFGSKISKMERNDPVTLATFWRKINSEEYRMAIESGVFNPKDKFAPELSELQLLSPGELQRFVSRFETWLFPHR